MGVQLSSTDPFEIERIRESEMRHLEERFKHVLCHGANVLMTTGGVEKMALRFFVQRGVMGFRRVARGDMRRVARATGAQIETMPHSSRSRRCRSKSSMGVANLVYQDFLAGNDVTVIKGCGLWNSVTVLIRGNSEFAMDEVERSVHDALCVLKRTMECGAVVPGGGAVEASLFSFLGGCFLSNSPKERIAISTFGHSLLAIPMSFTGNSSFDSNSLVSELCLYHKISNSGLAEKLPILCYRMGIDIVQGCLGDSVEKGVYIPASCSTNMLGFATDAAITVIRIDEALH
jgi:T-complex protein 1 subunit alpha